MLDTLLAEAVALNASDLHITVGLEPTARINGALTKLGQEVVSDEAAVALAREALDQRDFQRFESTGDRCSIYTLEDGTRFRVNAFRQKGSCAIAIRPIPGWIPTLEELNLPPVLGDLARRQRGLILVTGSSGGGKTTTLASMIDQINHTSSRHIITVEDPIEYLHTHKRSVVNQRELGIDTVNYAGAVRAAVQEDADVILVGELRDADTMAAALDAADAGHLVLSSMQTVGCVRTINRIITAFPQEKRDAVRQQLADVLQGMVSQQILPREDVEGQVPAAEVLVATPMICSHIREGAIYKIHKELQKGAKEKMQTMDGHLMTLFRRGVISRQVLQQYLVDVELLEAPVQ